LKNGKPYFMAIDLLLLSGLAIATELIGFYALKKYSGAGFSLSLSMLVTTIAMIRWGTPGFVVYPIANIPLVYANYGERPLAFLLCYYPFAACFAALSALFFLIKRQNDIKDNKKWFILFQFSAFLGVAFGKGMVTLLFQGDFGIGFLSFVLANIFSIIMGIIISLFLLKREGLITEVAIHEE
jgi:hypothetical protein